MRRLITILIGMAALLAAGWTIYQGTSSSETQRIGAIETGAIAPEFNAVNSAGEQVKLSDYRGKVVMINFWASWCTPCVREMPMINRIAETYQNDVETLFVNVGEAKGTIREFMEKQQFDFPVIIDVTGKISGLYRITGLPATMIVNQEGIFSHILLGELTEDIPLQQWLEETVQ
ncbi:redoxin domain-containing protein [Paenibacillus pabuli]|uniref:redoxin domain-containing protein n=1 Tax=Paenibacillus pabuli TaxID=1472 RepID=UPI001FE1B12D|nr:redoxin domain-containing protein [Paenibacillus pabuli]MEC0125206.1 redoxin domain-containing protein [Paenibacillus pabuli]